MALQPPDIAFASSPAPIDVSDAMRYASDGPIGEKLTSLESDDVTTTVQSPFEFNFFGQTYGYLCITSNGGIYPVASASSSCSNSYDQSVERFALGSRAPMIAALGADQHPGRTVSAVAADTAFSGKPTGEAFSANESDGFGIPGSIYYGTTTVNGNTAAVITWYRTVMYEDRTNPNTTTQTFQIVLIDGAANNFSTDWDMTIEYNYGQINADYDGYNVNGSRRWAVGWSDYDSNTNTALAYEFYADLPTANLIDSGSYALVNHSLNSDVPGRYIMGMQSGGTVGFQPVTPNPPTTFETTELGSNGGNLTAGQPVSEYLNPDVSSVCEVTSGSVPAGITFYPGTCQIAGTPTGIGPYEFEVTATNTAGSVSTTFSGDVAGPPPAPATDVTASVDGMDVTVSWVNPTDDGGSAINGAYILYTPQGCGPSATVVGEYVSASQNPFTYSNLAAGCTYSVSVKPHNSIGLSTAPAAVANTTVLPLTAPVWSETTVAAPIQGHPFTDGVVADMADSYEITAGALPSGLVLDASTGAITGRTWDFGPYEFTVGVTNSEGTVEQTISGTIVNRYVTLTDNTLAVPQHSATLEYSDFFTGETESNETVTYYVEGDLPAGLSIDAATGEISGIATEAGSFQFAVVASGPVGSSSTSYMWEIADRTSVAIDTDIVEIGTGIAVNDSIEVSYATGYAVTAGGLPAGLTLNSETGELTGTPTVAGPYEVTITAYGEISDVDVTLSGTVHTPVAAPAELAAPEFTHGAEEPVDLSVENATGYEVTAGELPEGLSLNAETGEVTGTPIAPGDYNFTVTANGPVN